MSFMKDIGGFIGGGVDAADRMAKVAKREAQLADISRKQEKAFSQLGVELYAKTKDNQHMRAGSEASFALVEDLSEKTATLRKEIEELKAASPTPGSTGATIDCPLCKKPVSYDFAICPYCSTDMAEAKATVAKCVACTALTPVSSNFCTGCGASMTAQVVPDSNLQPVETPVTPAPSVVELKEDTSSIADSQPEEDTSAAADETEGSTLATSICKGCSAPLAEGCKFCTSCGTKVGDEA